jgi:hypothetical protein
MLNDTLVSKENTTNMKRQYRSLHETITALQWFPPGHPQHQPIEGVEHIAYGRVIAYTEVGIKRPIHEKIYGFFTPESPDTPPHRAHSDGQKPNYLKTGDWVILHKDGLKSLTDKEFRERYTPLENTQS